MSQGRKAKPNELKKLEGVRPSRINEAAPEFSSDKNPKPPATLGEYGRQVWRLIYSELRNTGVLKKTDRETLKNYCSICESIDELNTRLKDVAAAGQDKYNTMTPSGHQQPRPEQTTLNQRMGLQIKYAEALGLTPSSRGRLVGEKGGPGKKISDFMLRGLRNGQQKGS